MKSVLINTTLWLVLCISILSCTSMQVKPPEAKKSPHAVKIHGDELVDPYHWMRERDSKAVIAHLKAENEYADHLLKPLSDLKETLFEEMKGRIKKDDSSVPYLQNGYYHYIRYKEDQEYPIYYRKKESLTAQEEVILDVNELAKGHSYYSVSGVRMSPNGQWIAFGVDTVGRRKYDIRFKNLVSGEILKEEIPQVTANMEWAADSEHLFFTSQDPETLRSDKIYRFHLPTKARELVYEEKDNTFGTGVTASLSGKYLFIYSGNNVTTEVRYLKADTPKGIWRVFEPRQKGHEYQIAHGGDRFYILTNWKAENFRLMETPDRLETTARTNWKELIPHDKGILRQGMAVLASHIALSEREGGLSQITVIDRKSKAKERLQFPEEAYSVTIGSNFDYGSKFLRYNYQSPKTPDSVYDYDLRTKKATLQKQQEVLGGFSRDNYTVEWRMAPARDGAQIPVSIIYRKSVKTDGTAPLLQYGYGSYGYSMEPSFNTNRLSLLDRGFIYVVAHIRGGSEMGRQWYENGKLLKKKNTFTDFIDVSEFLIKEKYTTKDKLVIMGGSAGGLLMGAVTNMRPELYKGVVAAVPFVDVINTMLDETLPLTTFEYDEWGNPNDPKYYKYIKSYSPYDNVKDQAYPHTLVTTGYHDSQVQYWEPMKWVAKLRDHNQGDSKIILQTDMDTGHSGTTGRFKSLELQALHYAFAIEVMNW